MVLIGQAGKRKFGERSEPEIFFIFIFIFFFIFLFLIFFFCGPRPFFYYDAASALLIIMELIIIIIIEDDIEIYKEKIGPASAGSAGPAATALP